MDVTLLTGVDLALVPVVIGVVAAIRQTGFVADRFAPLASIAVGMVASLLFPASTIGLTVLAGIVIGLSASGLYSGTKTTMQG